MPGIKRVLSAILLFGTFLTEVGAVYRKDNKACEIHKDNLLMLVPRVSTPENCRQICQNNNNCSFISYFGPNSFPFKEVCAIFFNCTNLHSCQDCLTEDRDFCYKTCTDNVEGELDGNIVGAIADVEKEFECKMNCMNNNNCNYYTHYGESHARYPNLCVLLAEIQGPVKICQHCSTGSRNCCSKRLCGFYLDSKPPLVESLKFTKSSINSTVRTIAVGSCDVEIVGIGGGGNAGKFSKKIKRRIVGNAGGGGGSGEVSMVSYHPKSSTNLLVSIGGNGEPSIVMTREGDTVMLAQPGEDGDGKSLNGGKGYSGGGGSIGIGSHGYGGSGGSNGGDGEGGKEGKMGYGGKGSGLKISEFGLRSFTLTPGNGGFDSSCGGGGGGVIINGNGPYSYNSNQGRGYGGGATGCKDHSLGSSGAVIMEIKK